MLLVCTFLSYYNDITIILYNKIKIIKTFVELKAIRCPSRSAYVCVYVCMSVCVCVRERERERARARERERERERERTV
jgi:hypothetical protein